MDRSDEELQTCADCGAEFSVAEERGFGVDPDTVLCFECAVRRGGRYDSVRERWERSPSLARLRLSDDRRGSTD